MRIQRDRRVREFYSSVVAKRTRAKTQALEDEIFRAGRISSARHRNNEPTPANLGSGAVPASIPRHNNVEIYDLEEVPVRKRGRKRKSDAHKRNGERSAAIDIEVVETIDESEFRRRRRRTASNMELSESIKDSEETNIDKIVDEVDEELRNLAKVSSVDHCESSCSKDSCNGTTQEKLQISSSFVNRGSNEEGVAAGGFGVEVTGESEFRYHARHSKSKKGRLVEQDFDSNPSAEDGGNQDVLTSCRKFKFAEIDGAEFTRGKSRTSSRMGSARQGSSAANLRKNADTVEELPVDSCCGYFTSEYSNRGSDNGQSYKSKSFTEKGNQDELTSCTKYNPAEISAAEFTRGKSRTSIRMGSSARQGSSAANSRKNAYTVEDLTADSCFGYFTPQYPNRGSDKGQTDKLRSFTKKGNQDGVTSCRKSKLDEINAAKFTTEKSRTSSRMGSSARQGYSAANSTKNAGIVQELSADNCTSKVPGRGFDKGQTDRSRSFSEKGNNVEDTDSDEIEIIDEPDIMRRKDYFTEVRAPTWQGPDGVHFASTSRKHVKSVGKKKSSDRKNAKSVSKKKFSNEKGYRNKKQRELVSKSRRMMNDESGKKDLHNDDDDSSDENISSDPSSKSSSENTSTFLPDDENSSDGAKHETTLRVVETRSKKSTKEPKEVGNSGLSPDPDSRSYEAECPDSVDGVEELGTKNLQNKESNCEQPTSQERKFRSRKRQPSSEASAKQRKGRKALKTCEIQEDNVERNRISADDFKEEGGLNERSTIPESTCPEQSYAQNNPDAANDQAEAGIMMQENKASSSHSKDDDNDDDEEEEEEEEEEENCNGDIPEETEAAEHVTDEPTGRQKVFNEQLDLCDRLAEAIMSDGSVFEGAINLVPPSQTESSLPLKFRFEDEVPKEVEKTQREKEVEGWFSELDSLWAFGELGSSNCAEVDEEDETPQAEETHLDRCNRGKHELIVQDDEGLICIYCQFVALGPKDIMPDWAEETHRGKRRYQEAEKPAFDGLDFQPSVNNAAADYGNNADGTVWSLKAGIRESMYEHQREGFEFLWKNLAGSIHLDELKSTNPLEVGGCIISHAPGTGKTRLTINFIETYLRMFPNCLPVIISPASMLLTWEEEFRKWNIGFPFLNLNNPECVTPEMKAVLKQVRGVNSRNQDAVRMVKIWLWSKGNSILGISYSLFEKLIGEKHLKGKKSKGEKPLNAKNQVLRMILLEKPGLVVLDEGHTPRNKSSNIWNALLKLKTDKRVILSGTPFQNNFGELFNTLHLVRPAIADVFTQERSFTEMSAARRDYKAQYNHSQSSLDKLKLIMAPFVHVHKGTILQQSLPGLRDCVILLKPSALQKSLIARVEGSSTQRTFEYEHRVALISVHPYLLADLPEKERIGIDMAAIKASKLKPNEGVKIKFILELVRLSMLLKEKVLIFSQFIQPLELIREFLKECFNWAEGNEILRMVGKMDQKQRQVLINAFNDPKNNSKVMLGSTKCCSEGISLVGASRVVLLDVVWNPSVERQAISRAYRIGQKKFVHTYHLMTSGTTEADKYYRQSEKERLSELVFTSSSNECKNQKQPALSIEDRVLEEMVGQEQLNGMFDKIINQPKDSDLIRTFGLN